MRANPESSHGHSYQDALLASSSERRGGYAWAVTMSLWPGRHPDKGPDHRIRNSGTGYMWEQGAAHFRHTPTKACSRGASQVSFWEVGSYQLPSSRVIFECSSVGRSPLLRWVLDSCLLLSLSGCLCLDNC